MDDTSEGTRVDGSPGVASAITLLVLSLAVAVFLWALEFGIAVWAALAVAATATVVAFMVSVADSRRRGLSVGRSLWLAARRTVRWITDGF